MTCNLEHIGDQADSLGLNALRNQESVSGKLRLFRPGQGEAWSVALASQTASHTPRGTSQSRGALGTNSMVLTQSPQGGRVTRRSLPENAVLAIGMVVFALFLLLPEPDKPLMYLTRWQVASATLRGKADASDVAQDIIGFRALVRQQDPYPILGPAGQDIGVEWQVLHTSTHPPTAFLLVAPIAFLPWRWAAAAWAWLMLALLVLTLRCYGVSWKTALGLTPVALLWPPVATSLGQMTIIWLFGLAAGYRLQSKRPLWSGMSIGLASMTKLFPGLLIVAFFLKRQWRALLGFVSIWLASLVILVLLHPGSIHRYLEVNRSTAPDMIWRADNSSLLLNSYRYGGWIGLALVLAFFLLIVWTNRDCLYDSEPFASPRLWRLLSYFTVALLPISWGYSIAPLLPIVTFLVSRRKLSTMIVGSWCIVISCVGPMWGPYSVLPLVLVNLLVGTGLLFDALPFRLFTAHYLRDLAGPSSHQDSTRHR